MPESIRMLMLYIGFFLFSTIVVAVAVLLIRYIYFKTSFHNSLQYCVKQKWIVVLFALGETLLFVVLDATIPASYIYYIIPGMVSSAAILVVKGTAHVHE